MLPRHTFLDYEHTIAVIEALAKFHAASFLEWEGDVRPILKDFELIAEAQWLSAKKVTSVFRKYVKNTFPEVALFLKSKGYELEAVKFANFFKVDDLFKRMHEITKVPILYPAAINHGDLWINNILFKYNDAGKIEELKFVDFQASKIGSRILDLSYLLFTSVRNDLLNTQMPEFLHSYFEFFQTSLSDNQELSFLHGYDLSWEGFNREWNEYKFYGQTLAVLYAPPMFATIENIPDLETLSAKDFIGEEDTKSKNNSDGKENKGFAQFMESPYTLSRLVNLVQHHLTE